ncbi:hypothetical protein CZ787_04435 [Halomonas citrativorans]|uniref:Uncharacterized protein n=1 Tax=Halomonas citrativorans TaxID=2742612 RepID=A0A1R4HTC9_9GAMM|nr:hypothetical protein CZ787_04435 [Halomonas citrativorans]
MPPRQTGAAKENRFGKMTVVFTDYRVGAIIAPQAGVEYR